MVLVSHFRQWIFKSEWMKDNDASSENEILLFIEKKLLLLFLNVGEGIRFSQHFKYSSFSALRKQNSTKCREMNKGAKK